MKMYRVSQEDYGMMREKIRAAQTLLNAHLVAELEGRQPPSTVIRLELAQEAEELVHDVADLLDSLETYVTVCGRPGPVTPDST
jgi:hypothetical protein